MPLLKSKKRKKKIRIEHFATSPINESLILDIAKNLSRQIDKKDFEKKYTPVKNVLKLVGAGVFLAASLAMPNLPMALKPFIDNQDEYEIWKGSIFPISKGHFGGWKNRNW